MIINDKCTECGEYVFFAPHRHACAPKFAVWQETDFGKLSEMTGVDFRSLLDMRSSVVYADNPKKAAEKYVIHIDDGDSGSRTRVYVAPYSTIEDVADEDMPFIAGDLAPLSTVALYEVTRELVPSYTAERVE